jgi:hypothetical protein
MCDIWSGLSRFTPSQHWILSASCSRASQMTEFAYRWKAQRCHQTFRTGSVRECHKLRTTGPKSVKASVAQLTESPRPLVQATGRNVSNEHAKPLPSILIPGARKPTMRMTSAITYWLESSDFVLLCCVIQRVLHVVNSHTLVRCS